jgi:hypothetical protein
MPGIEVEIDKNPITALEVEINKNPLNQLAVFFVLHKFV